MSTSFTSHSIWGRYGVVPLTRCPHCSRPEPLKRWVCKTDENGNYGREFVKCSSKTLQGRDGKILKKCGYFEWLDDYIERLQFEGHLDSDLRETGELNLPPPVVENWVENLSSGVDRVVTTTRNARNAEMPADPELNEELKKIKKYMSQMVDLQKQANIMAGGFYACIVALCFFYVLFIRG